MQHSPQEIKTKLGEAVDPEGNVLNMAAVVEVIGLLERTPLTKEALEQTRIGRTVNLLRKKTNDEDIARRAKRLVKKWQKLVQNHLEAVRNTSSPLNGIQANSPLINGSVKSEEQDNSPADATTKPERNFKGTKRKRMSVDSPTPVEMPENGDFCNNKNNGSQIGNILSHQSSLDSEETQEQYSEHVQNRETNLSKCLKIEDNKFDQVVTPVEIRRQVSETNSLNTASEIVSPVAQINHSDHTDVRWERKDVGLQTDIIGQDNQNSTHFSSELLLDIEQQANGINGRFSEAGNWCPWSESMSYNEGNLIILPYVLLE